MITRAGKVIVPVEDQQASLDFWTRCMGFTTVRDGSYGDKRWIELKPPDGTITNDWELRDDDGEWRPWRHTTMTRVGETDGGQA